MSMLQMNRVDLLTSSPLRKRRLAVRRPTSSLRTEVIPVLPIIQPVLRVLIIDACKDTVDSMATLVGLWGYDVARAYDTQDALHQAALYCPHVVMLDTSMYGGHENLLMNLLRELPSLENAVLVAITGNSRKLHRDICLQAGYDYFFLKPVRLSILQDILCCEQHGLNATDFPFPAIRSNIGSKIELKIDLHSQGARLPACIE